MSKVKRKAVFEGNNKSTGISSTVARPSVFERLGPNSSSAISSGKTQLRKGEDSKHKGHEKSSSSHSRESGAGATESLANHLTPKKVRKRSRSRDKKEQITDVRSKISFRPSESGERIEHKSKELPSHSPSPKRASVGESRRKEPETKIKSQVAVVTNRQTSSKVGEKGTTQPNEADWRTDRSHLDFQEESILERKRKQLQRELELEMQKERLEEKRASSSSSRSSSSAASSSSSNSDSSSSSSSSSSSEGEDNSFSSFSSLNANRNKKTKAMSKRATKMMSSQSGSNSETDIIRANKKGKVEQKSDLKKKVSRISEGDLRRDQQLKVNQDKKKKLTTTGGASKPKLSSGGVADARANPGGSSSSKHSGGQVKANEKNRKGSSHLSHRDNPYSETLKIRERSLSPNAGVPVQNRSHKSATASLKQSNFPKKKHHSDSSGVDVPNKGEKLKQSSRTKNSTESHKFKPRAPSEDVVHGSRRVGSPSVRGRHTPPHVAKINENHALTQVSKEKRLLRRPASPPPPSSSRLSDVDRSKMNRERRHSNSEFATKSFDSHTKKSPKDVKERKKEGNQVSKSDRFRDDPKSNRSSHVPEMHNPHSKHESDRGREIKRQRDVDSHSHSHSIERARLTESRGVHSPLRRERSVGKKSERMSSGSQHPGRDGIIDRLRDLSRTSMDVSNDYHGRRDSSGRNIPENPPETRNLNDDRLSRGNLERDRRGRLLPEEVNSRYEPPDMLDHRRRMLTPPLPAPGKYHSRNLTPPPRSTTPPPPLPPRQWSRDHPDPREPGPPYPSDRRKSPLPHHYGARGYNDPDAYEYDNRAADHRGRDHLSQRGQRKDSYHPFLPSDPIDIYDRDGRPRSRQGIDYGHNDQRRDDYRWENPRDDRLKGIPEPDRLREGDRWHDDEIKRKRAREDIHEQSSLPKRRRLTPPLPPPPPPPVENLRSSRAGAPTETGRTADSNKRKQLGDSGKGARSTISDGNKSSKQESSVTPSDIKNTDRSKRRPEPVKELNSENKNLKIEETKRKRPRTPEKSDRPLKIRKISPVHAAIEKQAEKIISSEPKTIADKEKIIVPEKEELKKKSSKDKPLSPSGENPESFSDWTDDSMDLLNQEEKVETSDKAAKLAELAETVPTKEIETTLEKDSNVEMAPTIIIKEEKITAQPSEILKVESSPLLQKDDKQLRKPKSEGGEDSRGSFEDSLKEKRSRDRNRSSSIKSKSTTSRHPSLERSTRRRYHELNKDKSRSKASSPVSRPRTPVSRPRTPVSPSRNVSESVPERDKKPPAKIVENIVPSVTEAADSLQPPPIFEEKVTVALDDCEYDPISDDEFEAMMEEPDVKDLENDKNVKQSSADTLDVDWASLVREKSQPPSAANKESVLKKFTPVSILCRIGVSSQFAGAELMERIEKVMADDSASREQIRDNTLSDSARPKLVFEEKTASLNAMSVTKKKERQMILEDIGPYRQALCARRDLKIRKKLCKLKLKEILPLSLNSVDVETFKLSLQVFAQRRSNVGLG